MNKLLLIFISLFVFIKPYCEPVDDSELYSISKIRDFDDCNARTSNDELKNEGAYKCCYLFYTQDSNNIYKEVDTCALVTQSEYDNIKDYVKRLENSYRIDDVKIKCFGISIKFSLLLISLYLFYLF